MALQTARAAPAIAGSDPPDSSCLAADDHRIAQTTTSSQGETFTNVVRVKRGGRRPRDKGARLARAIVRLFQDAGLGAERVPLSGAVGGSYLGDLTVPCLGHDLVVDAKSRANGFTSVYSWLQNHDALILRADRKEALVVVPLRLAAEILAAAELKKTFTVSRSQRLRENGVPLQGDAAHRAARPKSTLELKD